MTLAEYVAGTFSLAVVAVTVGAGAQAVRRRWLAQQAGVQARVSEAVIALALLLLTTEALGTVGLFRMPHIAIGCAITGTIAVMASRRRPAAATESTAGRHSEARPVALITAGVVALLAAQWFNRVWEVVHQGMLDTDTRRYHLPIAASFYQLGSITHLHVTEVDPETAFHPDSAELLHAVGMAAYHHDILSPFINLAWLALALAAGWCIGRVTGKGLAALLAVTAVLATPIILVTHPGSANNDVMALALFLAAIAIYLNATDAAAAHLAVAGAAAGLAVGTKLTMFVPVLALVGGVLALLAVHRRWRAALAWISALGVTGGYWYLRNLVRTGNPVPPLHIGIGPFKLPSPSLPIEGVFLFSVRHYALRADFWTQTVPHQLSIYMAGAWFGFFVFAAVGVVVALIFGSSQHRMLAIVAAVAATAYVFTPGTAAGPDGDPWVFGINIRYIFPAVLVGLLLFASPPSSMPSGYRWVTLGLLVVLLAATELFSAAVPEWLDGYRTPALILGAAVFVSGAAWRFLRWRPGPRTTLTAVGAGFLTVAVAGWFVQSIYLSERYTRPELLPNGGRILVWAQSVTDERVAVAGFSEPYPLYGRDLSNRVDYVATYLPHGEVVSIRNCREWRQALSAGAYHYVVTGSAKSGLPEPSPEGDWTAADRSATLLLREGDVRLFRIDGKPDPTTC